MFRSCPTSKMCATSVPSIASALDAEVEVAERNRMRAAAAAPQKMASDTTESRSVARREW